MTRELDVILSSRLDLTSVNTKGRRRLRRNLRKLLQMTNALFPRSIPFCTPERCPERSRSRGTGVQLIFSLTRICPRIFIKSGERGASRITNCEIMSPIAFIIYAKQYSITRRVKQGAHFSSEAYFNFEKRSRAAPVASAPLNFIPRAHFVAIFIFNSCSKLNLPSAALSVFFTSRSFFLTV